MVYIATGNNFADALVASVVAAMNGAPLLTVQSPGDFGDKIPQVTKDKLTELTPAKIVVLGGPAAVSDKVFNELKAYSPDVTRVEGEDRFETAALIANLVPDAVKRAFFADKAGDADTLDGKDSTAFALSGKSCPSGQVAKGTNASGNPICTPTLPRGDIVLSQQRNWWRNANAGGSVGHTPNNPGLSADVDGDWFHTELTTPAMIGGVSFGLKSVEICYKRADAGDKIDFTSISRSTTGQFAEGVAFDETDRTSATADCYVIAVNDSPPSTPVYDMTLAVEGHISIYRVSATFSPVS